MRMQHGITCPLCHQLMTKSAKATSGSTGIVRQRFECLDCDVIRWQRIENGKVTLDNWRQREEPPKPRKPKCDDYVARPWFDFIHPWDLRPCV